MKIAIIPARGGSKRIPNKNIIDFFGRPMLHYSIQAAVDSRLFDLIHVSTDSEAIADAAAAAGWAPEFRRPAELADDRTPIMPVLAFVLAECARRGRTFDTVSLILPCAPLIEGTDLARAHETFVRNTPRKPLMAVDAYAVPVEWAYSRRADGGLDPVQPGAYAIRSQDLSTKYFDAGTFYFYDPVHIAEDVSRTGTTSHTCCPRRRLSTSMTRMILPSLARSSIRARRQTDDRQAVVVSAWWGSFSALQRREDSLGNPGTGAFVTGGEPLVVFRCFGEEFFAARCRGEWRLMTPVAGARSWPGGFGRAFGDSSQRRKMRL